MCGLCGALSAEEHWSFGTASSLGGDAAERYRLQAHRVTLINRVLALHHIRLERFQSSSYVLTTATGKTEVIQDIGTVWATAEAMSGQTFDPLAPNFLR